MFHNLWFLHCRGRLLVGTVFGLVVHLVLTFCINNRAMNHVVDASTSSWLQEHMSDMSERWVHLYFEVKIFNIVILIGVYSTKWLGSCLL